MNRRLFSEWMRLAREGWFKQAKLEYTDGFDGRCMLGLIPHAMQNIGMDLEMPPCEMGEGEIDRVVEDVGLSPEGYGVNGKAGRAITEMNDQQDKNFAMIANHLEEMVDNGKLILEDD